MAMSSNSESNLSAIRAELLLSVRRPLLTTLCSLWFWSPIRFECYLVSFVTFSFGLSERLIRYHCLFAYGTNTLFSGHSESQ